MSLDQRRPRGKLLLIFQFQTFIVMDRTGTGDVERLANDSFLRTHLAMELQAVFPSTTTAALTSLATGLWPAAHGVPTWWAYLVEHGVSATVLPFVERFSERPLGQWGIKSDDIFTEPTLAVE